MTLIDAFFVALVLILIVGGYVSQWQVRKAFRLLCISKHLEHKALTMRDQDEDAPGLSRQFMLRCSAQYARDAQAWLTIPFWRLRPKGWDEISK